MSGLLLSLACTPGCSSASRPAPGVESPPLGAVAMQIGPGDGSPEGGAGACNLAPTGIVIATEATVWLVDYLASGVNGVKASCTVHSAGDAFDVHGVVALAPSQSFSLSGTMSETASTVQATFEYGGAAYESQGACDVDFTLFEGMGILSGRVWAHVTCPTVTDAAGHVCFASAIFAFEECAP